MVKSTFRDAIVLAAGILGGWFLIRYALPVLFPFLLGTGLALAAEPMVAILDRQLRLKRWLSAGIGVSGVFLLLVAILVLLGAVLFRQAGRLTDIVPELAQSVQLGMGSLEEWMLRSASAAPQNIRNVINRTVTGFFSDGTALVGQVAGTLPGILSRLFGHVTSGVLSLATAVLAAFMISAKLPRIREFLRQRTPEAWQKQYLPALKGLRKAVVGWLTAQLKLTVVVMGLLTVSFWLLRISHGVFWAAVISLVDALPVLGCGVVLVPWSLISLLQGNRLQCIGLLGTYALVWLARNVLEPRLLGKELGLDPLVTLLAIYAGYQLLGLPGMLLAPLIALILTKTLGQLVKKDKNEPKQP
jgi:sporulation integral membrane protein YtvI